MCSHDVLDGPIAPRSLASICSWSPSRPGRRSSSKVAGLDVLLGLHTKVACLDVSSVAWMFMDALSKAGISGEDALRAWRLAVEENLEALRTGAEARRHRRRSAS
jgi:hypothetical protein